ncbi:hypothetical protein IWQ61_002216 [Dispira simplex]|nr:hypothetical protein IWQ61_002216 [Dispira simplex]
MVHLAMENGRPQTTTTTLPHTTSLQDITIKRTWYRSLWALVRMHTSASIRDLPSLRMEYLLYGVYMILVIILMRSIHPNLEIVPEVPLPTLTGDCPSCIHVVYANNTPVEPLLENLRDLFCQSEPHPVKFQHFSTLEDLFNAYEKEPGKYVAGFTIPNLESALKYTLPPRDGNITPHMPFGDDTANTFVFHCNHTTYSQNRVLKGRCPTLMAYTERAFYNLFRDTQDLPRLESPLPPVASPASLSKHVIGVSALASEGVLGFMATIFAMGFVVFALSRVIMAVIIQGKARSELLVHACTLLSVTIYVVLLCAHDLPKEAKVISEFFLPPISMVEGLQLLYKQVSSYDEPEDPIGKIFISLTSGSVFYYLIGWYLHSVFPGSQVRSLGWLFPLAPSYWLPSRITPDCTDKKLSTETSTAVEMSMASHGEYQSPTTLENPMIEKDAQPTTSRSSQPVIRMEGLCKEFQKRKTKGKQSTDDNAVASMTTTDSKHVLAVNNLSLDFHGGEITGSLGHNGAGKSTVVGILSSSTLPTRGQVNMVGLSLPNAGENQVASYSFVKALQSYITLCPQDNIFVDYPSRYENLELYFDLRGLVVANDSQRSLQEARRQYINEYLVKVRLLEFADQLVTTYSGGMKRRLAIAIALMGDPWLVLLDEPTTGMDVYSLQYVWQFIQERKADHRAVVLTTHGMEEADILSDRLAIMKHGKLSAYGTPLFLKSQLNSGYTLALTKETERESE